MSERTPHTFCTVQYITNPLEHPRALVPHSRQSRTCEIDPQGRTVAELDLIKSVRTVQYMATAACRSRPLRKVKLEKCEFSVGAVCLQKPTERSSYLPPPCSCEDPCDRMLLGT